MISTVTFLTDKYFELNNFIYEGPAISSLHLNEKIKDLSNLKIWEVDLTMIENALKKDVRVKSVIMETEYPNKIKVKIEEEKPFSKVKINSRYYIANKEGKIFAYDYEYKTLDLPIIIVESKEEVNKLNEVLVELSDSKMFKHLSDIKIINKNVVRFNTDLGIMIKTSKYVKKEKYDECAYMISHLLKKNNKIEYIDLRYNDFVVKE